MTHAINSSTKLLSIDMKRAYSDDKELKRQRVEELEKIKVGIKEKKRKENVKEKERKKEEENK